MHHRASFLSGSKPGDFLARLGVTATIRGHLFVVIAYNHRVQEFGVPT
jgi:hypothetical protein